MYDVSIIGAGVVGCALARHLSQYDLKICLIDKADDVGTGATKANSGIVHGAYATKHGTLKAALAKEGNGLYDQLEAELHFGFHRIGAFVLAFDENESMALEDLYANGLKNGSEDMELLAGDQVRQMEPMVSSAVIRALWAKDVGVASPYELAIALAENAKANGVDLLLGHEVTGLTCKGTSFEIQAGSLRLASRYVVNAAGLFTDQIAGFAGDQSFTILPRKGQYVLLDRQQGSLVSRVLFQVPSKLGKGILVTRTCHGNLMLGPNAEDLTIKEDYGTDLKSLEQVVEKAMNSVPGLDMRKAITTYSGVRAISDNGDFIVAMSETAPGLLHLAGIDSPGLTASPAIARRAAALLEASGLNLKPRADYKPDRPPIIRSKTEDEVLLLESDEPEQHMICRCERVTEAEIVDAIHRGINIVSTDMIKRRTRAGMGPCQGSFCRPRVAELITRETGLADVPLRGPKEGPKPDRVTLSDVKRLGRK